METSSSRAAELISDLSELRSQFVVKAIGQVTLALALEQQEISHNFHSNLTDEEFLEYEEQLDHFYNSDVEEDAEPTPLDQMAKAEMDFEDKISLLFGEIDGFRFSGFTETSIGLKKGDMVSKEAEFDLYIDQSEDKEIKFSKVRRFVDSSDNDSIKQELTPTKTDKKVLEQAISRLADIYQQLQTKI